MRDAYTDVRVSEAINNLGALATTARVAEMAGVTKNTVARNAPLLGYVKPIYGGPWLRSSDMTVRPVEIRPTTSDQNEVVEALNRMADTLERLNGSIKLRPGVTQEQARAATALAEDRSAPLDQRYAAINTIASFLLADQLQN